MIRLYYLKTPLLWDLLRGFLGLAVTLLPLILLDRILSAIIVILAAIAGLFVIFIVRTALRHKTEIQLSQDEIRVATPIGSKEIAWLELTGVTLSYFSTSRSGSGNGVMTLKLSDGTTVIRIDSNLNSFDTVVKQVARVCSKVPVAVSPTTVHNFDALGAPIAGDDPPDAG
ncbi:hypothetical protein [Hwanghaeella sp. LZ110]|uniref:hypothetical protein n=1 Tax=Hwanghaeella sp. LZ110 TaxID=3402810 RepID=UPI003B67E759